MKTENEKSEEKENIENNKNEEISEASEDISENADQEEAEGEKVNLAQFITTPYERVLSIINEAKSFILSICFDKYIYITNQYQKTNKN